MKKKDLNKNYWETKYLENETGWDIGYISTPLKTYIDQLKDTSLKILIPGAGNSYEAEYLWHKGFKNIHIVDIAKQPITNFLKRIPDFPEQQILHSNFFEIENQFDLIIEQTFFCALDPKMRDKYVDKMYYLLTPKGKLVGLLFNFPLTEKGPPFGGNANDYKLRFEKKFRIKTLETAFNSIKERDGKELFFIFESQH
ncbi:MAG: methyltransferase domain-containing protein [Winogradskyella sp.]